MGMQVTTSGLGESDDVGTTISYQTSSRTGTIKLAVPRGHESGQRRFGPTLLHLTLAGQNWCLYYCSRSVTNDRNG